MIDSMRGVTTIRASAWPVQPLLTKNAYPAATPAPTSETTDPMMSQGASDDAAARATAPVRPDGGGAAVRRHTGASGGDGA